MTDANYVSECTHFLAAIVKGGLDEVVAGLQSNSEQPIPLESVHIMAKLVDLAAEVSCTAI